MSENPEHSAAYKLFHYPFDCTIPAFYLYSKEYVQTFGIASSGVSQIDESQSRAPQRVRLTPAAMAMYFDEGAPIGLINPRDSVRIYQYLREHLIDWQNSLNRDVNRRDSPVDDLRMLENFAAEIYKVARCFMAEMPEDSSLFNKLRNMGSRRAVRRRGVEPEVKTNMPEEHNPIVDSLATEQNKRNKRWA